MLEVTVILGDPRLPDNAKRGKRFNPEDFEAFDRMKQALAELAGYRFTYLDDHSTLLADILRQRPSFVLNFCDTGFANDARREAHIPAFLEMLEIAYSGAGPACLALCYDKALVRWIAGSLSIPVPAEVSIGPQESSLPASVRFPAFVKPSCGDGSVGITRASLVQNAREARAYVDGLHGQFRDRDVLVQEYLSGAEYSVGLIGNPDLGFTALPLLEVDYSGLDPELPPILAYESKADPTSPYWTDIKFHAARVDERTRNRLIDDSQRLFERLQCRDYARFDYRADAGGEVKLLEVNPNAAWCWDGKLNMMAGFAGYDYSQFLQLILQAAETRVAGDK